MKDRIIHFGICDCFTHVFLRFPTWITNTYVGNWSPHIGRCMPWYGMVNILWMVTIHTLTILRSAREAPIHSGSSTRVFFGKSSSLLLTSDPAARWWAPSPLGLFELTLFSRKDKYFASERNMHGTRSSSDRIASISRNRLYMIFNRIQANRV